MQDPTRPPISLNNDQRFDSPKFKRESPQNQENNLQASQEVGGGFFITESPGVAARKE